MFKNFGIYRTKKGFCWQRTSEAGEVTTGKGESVADCLQAVGVAPADNPILPQVIADNGQLERAHAAEVADLTDTIRAQRDSLAELRALVGNPAESCDAS